MASLKSSKVSISGKYTPQDSLLRSALERLAYIDKNQKLPEPYHVETGAAGRSRVYFLFLPSGESGINLVAKFDEPERSKKEWRSINELRRLNVPPHAMLPVSENCPDDRCIIYNATQGFSTTGQSIGLGKYIERQLTTAPGNCIVALEQTFNELKLFYGGQPGAARIANQAEMLKWSGIFLALNSPKKQTSLKNIAQKGWNGIDWDREVFKVGCYELPNPFEGLNRRILGLTGRIMLSRVHGDLNLSNIIINPNYAYEPEKAFIIDLTNSAPNSVTAKDFARMESEFWQEHYATFISQFEVTELLESLISVRNHLEGRGNVRSVVNTDLENCCFDFVATLRKKAELVLKPIGEDNYLLNDYFHCLYFSSISALFFKSVKNYPVKTRLALVSASLALLTLNDLESGRYGEGAKKQLFLMHNDTAKAKNPLKDHGKIENQNFQMPEGPSYNYVSKHHTKKTPESLSLFQTGISVFTKDQMERTNDFRSIFLKKQTYGTIDTNLTYIDRELIDEVYKTLKRSKFCVLYGNSGRGKTFFIFQAIRLVAEGYARILYYSPNFQHDIYAVSLLPSMVSKYLKDGTPLLVIMDDGHLVDDDIKNELVYMLSSHNNLHYLLVSRQKEEMIPEKYLHDTFYKNFNKIAETTYKNILDNFSYINSIELTDNLRADIGDEIETANLVFLTLILLAWQRKLSSQKNLPFDEVCRIAYKDFLVYYEKDKPRNWRFINHIVAALFQYEIRIDKNYLTPDHNKNLARHGLESYLSDKLVYKKIVTENNENTPFYVFSDFGDGEEFEMMLHSSEFRFYLKAHGRNLAFYNTCDHLNLDRHAFTKLALKDYILFKPSNIQELQERLRKNCDKREYSDLLMYFTTDPKVNAIMQTKTFDILNKGLLLTKSNG